MGSITDTSTGTTGSTKRGMYSLKPAFQLPPQIELPTNMYSLSVKSSTPACAGESLPFLVTGTQDDDINLGTTATTKVAKTSPTSNGNSNEPVPRVPSGAPLSTASSKEKSNIKVPFQKAKKDPVNPVVVSGHSDRVELLSEKRVLAIETRQLELIQKLNCLKELITQISQDQDGHHSLTDNIDVVVNADPGNGGCPYSLLFFHKLLIETYGRGSVHVNVHVHSSLNASLPEHVHNFNQALLGDIDSEDDQVESLPGSGLEFILNPLQSGVLTGESNFARYLSRLLPISSFPLNYDSLDAETLIQVDSYLDTEDDDTNFDAIEQHLKLLNTNSFLIGDSTIADFITYSNVANRVAYDTGRLTAYPNIENWLKNCELFGQFQLLYGFVTEG